MKNRLFFKLLILAVVTVFSVTSCKDYDDDISKLEAQISDMKKELPAKIDAVKSELTQAMDTKIKAVNDEVANLKGKLAELEKNKASKEELDATKKEILEKTVAKETYEAFVKKAEAQFKTLKEDLDKKATKEELNAYKGEVAGKLAEIDGQLESMDVELKTLKGLHNTLRTEFNNFIGDYKGNVQGILTKIANLKSELSTRIDVLDAILKVEGEKSQTIEDINTKLANQLTQINANKTDITNLRTELQTKYDELVGVDQNLQTQITTNAGNIENNKTEIDNIKTRLQTIEGDITTLKDRMTKAETAINLNLSNIFVLSRQLKGLTFIPTRGLPNEKTMKLYYYAGDYTANHVLMYRINPNNAKLDRDFNLVSLNYQITTRSAGADGIDDNSAHVDVVFNGEPWQVDDILYVPVHIQGKTECEVYGNHPSWHDNDYFFGPNKLLHWKRAIPGDIFDEPSYDVKEKALNGLSLVLTAETNSVEEPENTKVTVKSSEMVNTELIPTQIRLAESRAGKGNQIIPENLTERLLKTTLEEATVWANQNENNLPTNDKNWNVLTWSGNQGVGGVWTPGSIDLYDYVSSFYYPQDGGDLQHANVVPGDPHRYLYAEFGKEFGKPYTDKPNYEKPVYEFKQVAYVDENHNIIIDQPGGSGSHQYVTLDGSILTVINNPAAIQGVRNKKVIIEVTQVNSKCPARQPVGYLVLKYTDSPTGQWSDVHFTIDMTQDTPDNPEEFTSYSHLPYYHKACEDGVPVGQLIKAVYTETNDPNSSTTHVTRNALLEKLDADKWMNPINAPNSWGIANGKANPGDVHTILGFNPQLNGIGEHNMGEIYNIQGDHASVVPGSTKFTAAAYNHVNDPENKVATGVEAEDALKHIVIRYEYENHSYVIYADDHAPAGTYEIQYKLENKKNNTQHGNVLYLTFKFKVALRKITVEHDKNTVNWMDDDKTIRVQHTRISNTINNQSAFLSDDGYRVDLKQAFVLKEGTTDMIMMTTEKLEGDDGNPNKTVGSAPIYNPKFEFIQSQAIIDAGFTYERNVHNILNKILFNGKLAAKIVNGQTQAQNFNYLYIPYTKEGDMLYNYLMSGISPTHDLMHHNVLTKWGKTELMKIDDMERLLPVRLVTDINKDCALDPYKFPNGNYYYVDDFNIKFERALRWVFTEVSLEDNQEIQGVTFNFKTKVETSDESTNVYRGLFDHAYETTHGYGNLVYPGFDNGKELFFNPDKQAQWYGVTEAPTIHDAAKMTESVTVPKLLLEDGSTVDDANVMYGGINHDVVEVSTDGGKTWNVLDKDYFQPDHTHRFFEIGEYDNNGEKEYVLLWQGDQLALTSPLYFRIPVYNKTALDNGFAPDKNKNYYMTFRNGHAAVKGYAVFKVVNKK